MPCNSDHMRPNQLEGYSRNAAKLIVYASAEMGLYTPPWIKAAADEVYGNSARHNELTQMLCGICKRMTPDEQQRIIYDGRNPKARQLAEWWQEHQEADARREAAEKAKAPQLDIARAAWKKLTREEQTALTGVVRKDPGLLDEEEDAL